MQPGTVELTVTDPATAAALAEDLRQLLGLGDIPGLDRKSR